MNGQTLAPFIVRYLTVPGFGQPRVTDHCQAAMVAAMTPLFYRHNNRVLDHPNWLIRYWQITALAYAAIGMFAMLASSPHVPYADQWNHYAHLLQRPFFAGIFSADNGHAEVLPNLLRLIELHVGSHEILQIFIGAAFAAGSVLTLLDLLRRDRELGSSARAASALAIVLGIYWLGNTRALTQEHDAVHVYSVMLSLCLALRLSLCPVGACSLPRKNIIGIIALCVFASLSFGSGIASFAAVAALLIVQRVHWRQVAIVFVAALGTILLYHALPGAMIDRSGYEFGFEAIGVALRLLGSPFVYLFWPLLDPTAAAQVPIPLRDGFVDIANSWTTHFGDIHLSVFPQAGFGLLAIALAGWTSARAWRLDTLPAARIGIALAWFGISVAGLIAITRTAYFGPHPDQIYAPRYLPWMSLCWSGLLLAGLARATMPRSAFMIGVSLPLLVLPSEIGMGILGRHRQNVAEDIALAGTVGVFPQSFALGETDLEDLQLVLPLLRDAHMAMFAWPEARLLGRSLHGDEHAFGASDIVDVVVTPAQNRLGDPAGSEINAQFASSCNRQRVLAVADNQVIGLLRPQPDGRWRGVVQGQPAIVALTFYALCQ